MKKPLLDQLGFDSILFASALFEYSDLAIFLINVHGKNNFTYKGLNPTHERLTGLKSIEIMDKHPHDFLQPELADRIVTHYEECRSKKTTIIYEETIPFDGRDTFWITRLIPLLDENQEVIRIIGASINIDDRKQMEQQLLELVEFNQTILDLSHMGFLIFDKDGYCISINEAAKKIFGIEKKEEFLSTLFQNLHPRHKEQWETLLKTPQYVPEVSIINQNKEKKWLSLQSTLYHHNNRQFLLVSVTDISFTKAQQEELEEKNNLIMNLLQHVPNPVIVFHEDGIICFYNKQSEEEFSFLHFKNNITSIQEFLPFLDGPKAHLYPNQKRKKIVEVSLHIHGRTKNYILEQNIIGKHHASDYRILWSFTNITSQTSFIKKLLKDIHRDFLTGLYNRRGMEEILPKEWKRAIREKQIISLLMLDIDYFKNYNDTLGHAAGDKCLREVASLLQKACYRPGDFVFRYGGEEFLILLTNTNPEGALVVAKRIHTLLVNNPIPHPSSPLAPQITVSIGVYSSSSQEMSLHAVLTYADTALYLAKKNGRNRTEVFFNKE